MSERELIQDRIVEFLERNDKYFNAPYGVLTGMSNVGKGKIRTISFGVSRYLDGLIEIWNASKIIVKGQGGLAYKFEGTFRSCDALLDHFAIQN